MPSTGSVVLHAVFLVLLFAIWLGVPTFCGLLFFIGRTILAPVTSLVLVIVCLVGGDFDAADVALADFVADVAGLVLLLPVVVANSFCLLIHPTYKGYFCDNSIMIAVIVLMGAIVVGVEYARRSTRRRGN